MVFHHQFLDVLLAVAPLASAQQLDREWGGAFKMLLEERGVKRGRGKTNQYSASTTMAEAAKSVGAKVSTGEKRMRLHDEFEKLPAVAQEAVKAGAMLKTQLTIEFWGKSLLFPDGSR